MNLFLALGLVLGGAAGTVIPPDSAGQAVDIAPSAYQYRADRKTDANPPESWIALMHAAGLPLNRPVDRNAPAIRHALCSLLWEEIRPIRTLELSWSAGARHIPPPELVTVSALLHTNASSSWWNNLRSVTQDAKPALARDGKTYSFTLDRNTCGLVINVAGSQEASQYDIPRVRVLTADTWKQQEIEIEWGFDASTRGKDYSGHVEAYDGRIADVRPLSDDRKTVITGSDAWRSRDKSVSRRGIRMRLLYMGTSTWRKQQPYTTQPDDVARTIVTVWTKAGSFSFLAADLENGPILAPEYGFFVRRTSPLPPPAAKPPPVLKVTPIPFSAKMDEIAGSRGLKGWGSDETPWFGSNPGDRTVSTRGITIPPQSVAMHPGQFVDVVAEWRSPIAGFVTVGGVLTHAQAGGNGIEWWVARDGRAGREILGHGTTDGTGSQAISPAREKKLERIRVAAGDRLSLILGPKGDHRCDTILLGWTIEERGGGGRIWNLARDVAATPHEGNPHQDRLHNQGVWRFCSEPPMFGAGAIPSEPPIVLDSHATSAKAFEKQLAARRLRTIREQTRAHAEETWEEAVIATRGAELPPHPLPPAGSEPAMQVQVPSQRLTAQWNLGAWHLVRHCGVHPKTGRRWFNDYPYGILAAETYLILSVLDQMGSHQAAADGFDQWLSLPLDRNPPGTDPAQARPDHPVGLFSEGHGALTYAEGPPGAGGNMDGIHAFGPGSIGWALTQHYWMTGDREWLKAAAPRMIANAEWMLRQRRVCSGMVAGGDRLWCKGLQPALQVTPDSGGLWMQFYECEAYYWASIARLAETVAVVNPADGARLRAEAESYRKDLKAAVDRSITLSPVVPVRNGTYHSVVPFACYVRGLSTGAWGWQRDGSGSHVGPLYWDTVQNAAALVSPAGLLSPQDVRVQGYLDVLEDRLLLENNNVGSRNWFFAGWQYQGGLERTANMHLAADDIPVFLRSFLNGYAVDILPKDGYVFNEHAVHGPPDKIFEEAAFLERFRDLLVMEDGPNLWLARGAPRAWFDNSQRISVQHAPTAFGEVSYSVVADTAKGKITAIVSMPARSAPKEVRLRLRHPLSARMTGVLVNGKPWKDFDSRGEMVKLHDLTGTITVEALYMGGR